jgi:hypothetical protein
MVDMTAPGLVAQTSDYNIIPFAGKDLDSDEIEVPKRRR